LSINGGGENSWETFDYILNRTTPTSSTTAVEAFRNGTWSFSTVGNADYIIDNDTLIISIPRTMLGITDGDLPVINFKWVDGVDINGDLMNLYGYGESAPNHRFTYRIDIAEGLEIIDIIMGDLDDDTAVTIADAVILYSGILGNTKFNTYQTIVADVNKDGKYDIIDVMTVLHLI